MLSGDKMIYFKLGLYTKDVMAILTREDEKVMSHESHSSSAAENEAEKADGEDLDSFTHA